MRSKLFAAGLAVVALSVAACGSSGSSSIAARPGRASGARPTRVYRVQLSGTAETSPGAPHGSGAAVIAFHGDSMVCWRFAHLHGFTNATFAHIRIGTDGRSGNVVVPLSTGPRLHHQGCVSVSPLLSKAIRSKPTRYYVNIRSKQYPGGAVRAQL